MTFAEQTRLLSESLASLGDRRLLLFGGKGGVGKTTLATLAALTISAERRVILFSSDPASNLRDILREPVPNLDLRELHAEDLYRNFLERNLPSILELADRGTYLDREEIGRFFHLALPGVDELMSWIEIDRLVTSAGEAIVIVDTAPTGHTLRMLGASEHVAGMTAAFEAMQRKHRDLVEQLTRRTFHDEIDDFITRFRDLTTRVSERLADPTLSAFIPVMLPEPLVLAQTLDLVSQLRSRGMGIPFVLLNHATGDCDCGRCRSKAVREEEAANLFPEVVRAPESCAPLDSVDRMRAYLRGEVREEPTRNEEPEETKTELSVRSRLLFFAGKGGVGKTTCALSVAIQSALAAPQSRFVLLSVDPAESLTAAGRHFTPPQNLEIRTIDTRASWRKLRGRLGDEIAEAVAALTPRGMNVVHDQEIVEQLLDVAPPGADEIFAVMKIASLMGDESIARIFVDTAPTGHFLRLIDLPETAGEWVREFMRLLLRYRDVIAPGTLGEELLDASKSLRAFHEALRDPASAGVVLVSRPESVVVAETLRLRQGLRDRGVTIAGELCNYVTPLSECSCDRTRRAHEEESMARLGEAIRIERQPDPPRALDDLRRLVPLRHTP
jgi:arsenite-transporting ATPase